MTLPRFVPLVVLLPMFITTVTGGQNRTLQSFGVRVERGQPVYPLPSNVALGLFNLEDPFLDVAYYAEGRVQVFQNLGNGLFAEQPVYERRVAGEVTHMQWRVREMFYPSASDLILTYADGREETLTHEQMMQQRRSFASLPQMTSNFPPLNFREVWRSQTQTQPSPHIAIDDLDNDGRMEIVYAFYRLFNDSARFVVYKCVGNDSFVVSWDTTLRLAYGPIIISDVDNNGQKEIVFGKHSGGHGQLVLLECLGPGQYRYYNTNISYWFPPFKLIEADVKHSGRKTLVLLTSAVSPYPYDTFVYVAEFFSKGATNMSFSIQTARVDYEYRFDMAVGQVDGMGWDEIVLGRDGMGLVHQQVPVEYLWHDGTDWRVRYIHTGLRSVSTAPMFVNLDADTTQEMFIGGVGPIGHGSCFALKHVSDTTWTVLWADSSLRNTPLSVNAGVLESEFVVAGANTVQVPPDYGYSDLHVYLPGGTKVGTWRRDSASVQNFHFLDIDNDGRTNLVTPVISPLIPDHIAVYEYYGSTNVDDTDELPTVIKLFQNYPNPFNPMTRIGFAIPRAEHVRLKIYNVLGQEVANLLNETKPPGRYEIEWHARDFAGGVYFYQLQTPMQTITKKMLLLR
jgi:hypothetical protein